MTLDGQIVPSFAVAENQGDHQPDQREHMNMLNRNIVSPLYRGVHVNGVLGGFNQLGEMYIAVYAERPSNPDSVVTRLFSDGTSEVVPGSVTGAPGIVHEVEVGLYMHVDIAEQFAQWLAAKVKEYRDIQQRALELTVEQTRAETQKNMRLTRDE